MEKVAILRCEDYGDKLQSKVDEMFDCLGGINSILSKGQKVVLKVNLVCGASPDRQCTTNPQLVECVAKRIIEFGCQCVIADSPGGPFTASYLKSIYAKTEMTEVCKNMEKLSLNNDFTDVKVEKESNHLLKEFEILNILNEADVIINMSKFKTHTYMGFTGAVKNMFGAIPGLLKVEMHSRFVTQDVFSQMLVDIFETLKEKIKLNITDAVWGMEGQGPTGGNPINVGYLLASQNAYYLDYVQASMMTKEINQFPLISTLFERNLIDKDNLVLVGDESQIPELSKYVIPQCEVYSALKKAIPPFLQPFFHKLMTRRPVIKRRKCVGCGKCAGHCPVKAIEIEKTKKGRKAKVCYQKCIRCFCCQELCPFNAVKIKTGILHKLIRLKTKKQPKD